MTTLAAGCCCGPIPKHCSFDDPEVCAPCPIAVNAEVNVDLAEIPGICPSGIVSFVVPTIKGDHASTPSLPCAYGDQFVNYDPSPCTVGTPCQPGFLVADQGDCRVYYTAGLGRIVHGCEENPFNPPSIRFNYVVQLAVFRTQFTKAGGGGFVFIQPIMHLGGFMLPNGPVPIICPPLGLAFVSPGGGPNSPAHTIILS